MLHNDINQVVTFFSHCGELSTSLSAEELAKQLGLNLPDMLKGSIFRMALPEDEMGAKSFFVSTVKNRFFGWLMSFLVKSKCYLVCWEVGARLHCVHICVTCFDGFPGPGCYLHGSYD